MARVKEIKNNNKANILDISSAQIIPIGFLLLILLGTILLMLPVSTADGQSTSLVTALFTSTTSVCVTGLVVVDTFAHWSLFGQIVILVLIQLGGLGIVAVTSTFMLALHKKFSLKNRLLLMDAFNLDTLRGLVRFLMGVLKGTFLVEGIGACLYAIRFVPAFGAVKGIWYSIFTSISAFCNAGIDVLGPNSLIDYNKDLLVLITTMLLIVFGGLGYVVWFDVLTTIKNSYRMGKSGRKVSGFWMRLSEHSKLAITLTISLIVSGAILVFILEYNNPDTIGNMGFGGKAINSLFQSITFRTAGFAAVPQEGLTGATALMGCIFMFIGGSPVGTAGGVKTVTFFAVLISTVSFIRGRDECVVYNRKIATDTIQKATAIIAFSFMITFVLCVALIAVEGLDTLDAIYEMVSATATVGLSRSVTPTLHTAGRLIVITAMYLGRIGPISLAIFFTNRKPDNNDVNYADGRYIVG